MQGGTCRHPDKNIIADIFHFGKSEEVLKIEKKMGRPTNNPRTEKIGFRMSPAEIEDIEKCAAQMDTQRVNAVVAGIKLLKEKLNIE